MFSGLLGETIVVYPGNQIIEFALFQAIDITSEEIPLLCIEVGACQYDVHRSRVCGFPTSLNYSAEQCLYGPHTGHSTTPVFRRLNDQKKCSPIVPATGKDIPLSVVASTGWQHGNGEA